MAKFKLSSPQRRKHFMENESDYKSQKSAHGAHGGGVSYEQCAKTDKFETHKYLTKNLVKPGKQTALSLNKAAGYNK